MCDPDLPWEGLNVKKRLGRLRQLHQNADRICRTNGNEKYGPEAKRIYDLLRQTWERAAEEVLLNGVVQRFEPGVHTKQATALTDIKQDDCTQLTVATSKCSGVVHDPPVGAAEPPPEPAELLQDIQALDDWVNGIRQRRP